ncbi:MAG: hypothetical protein ACR2JM_05860 [Mycobacterium sp.]
MTPMKLGRTLWIGLSVASAVVVVILSWRVPEPESSNTSVTRIENISYMQCAAPEVAPPSYGTRSVSNITCAR